MSQEKRRRLGPLILLILGGALAAQAQPLVSLGPDRLVCGSDTLDAGNPGAAYLWSTGETTQSIIAAASGLYWVEVSNANGTTRDSLNLTVLLQPSDPVTTDTSRCGPGVVPLVASFTGETVLWYGQPTGGSILNYGSPAQQQAAASTTYYAQGISTFPQALGAPDNTVPGAGFSFGSGDGRGLRFTALQDLLLRSVHVYPKANSASVPMTFTVELRSSANVLLQSRQFSFLNPAQVKTEIPLWFDVPVGTDYRLVINNLLGGTLGVNTFTTPSLYSLPGVLLIIDSAPTNFSNQYFFFYDWRVATSPRQCRSTRVPLSATVLPNPSVELGADTLLCGGASLLLDAANPGASYLWSTGDTTPSLLIDSSGVFGVTVNLGFCSQADSISVLAAETPSAPLISDTSFCSPQEILLSPAASSGQILWFSVPADGQILSSSSNLSIYVSDTTQLFVEAINSFPQSVGLNNNVSPLGGAFIVVDGRGITFNAEAPLIIESVFLYLISDVVGQPVEFDMELRNSSNQVLQSRRFSIISNNGNVKREIDTWFRVEAGNGYRLLVSNMSGGRVYQQSTSSSVYPLRIPGLITLTDNVPSTGAVYQLIYDWQVLALNRYCASARVPLTVSVKLPLSLPDYIYACDDTLISAGNFPGAFTWGGGQQGPSLLVEESGIYSLAVTDNAGCFAFDTVEVEIPRTAGLQDDGILCGNTLITNYDETANFLWSTGDTSATLTISQPGVYSVAVAEPRGCFLRDTITVTGFDVFPTVSLGPDVVACDSAELDAGNPGFSFLWSTGDTTQVLTVFSSGAYEVVVTNSNECASRDTVGVLISQRPVADFFVPDTVYSGDLSVTFFNFSGLGSYRWDLGDGTTSSLFEPEHTYVDTGFYCVELIVTDIISGCGRDTFERCFTLLRYPLSLDPAAGRGWLAYPNPARDALFLRWQAGSSGLLRVELINAMGQVLLQRDWLPQGQEPLVLPVGALARGLYVLRVSGPEGSSSQPLMLRY